MGWRPNCSSQQNGPKASGGPLTLVKVERASVPLHGLFVPICATEELSRHFNTQLCSGFIQTGSKGGVAPSAEYE